MLYWVAKRNVQVMIAHQNVIAQCLQIEQITPPDLKQVLAVLPLFHSKSFKLVFAVQYAKL